MRRGSRSVPVSLAAELVRLKVDIIVVSGVFAVLSKERPDGL